jgi:hypothetical protein
MPQTFETPVREVENNLKRHTNQANLFLRKREHFLE